MSKMQLIAKLTLISLGIHVLMVSLNSLSFSYLIFAAQTARDDNTASKIIAVVTFFAILLGAAYYLLFKSDVWAQKLACTTVENVHPIDKLSAVAGFRLTMFILGAFMIAGSIDIILKAGGFAFWGPKVIVNMVVYKYVDDAFIKSPDTWLKLFGDLLKAALGIYLVLGAPHFVRWQMGKLGSSSIQQNI